MRGTTTVRPPWPASSHAGVPRRAPASASPSSRKRTTAPSRSSPCSNTCTWPRPITVTVPGRTGNVAAVEQVLPAARRGPRSARGSRGGAARAAASPPKRAPSSRHDLHRAAVEAVERPGRRSRRLVSRADDPRAPRRAPHDRSVGVRRADRGRVRRRPRRRRARECCSAPSCTAEDGRVEVGRNCVVMENALVRGRGGIRRRSATTCSSARTRTSTAATSAAGCFLGHRRRAVPGRAPGRALRGAHPRRRARQHGARAGTDGADRLDRGRRPGAALPARAATRSCGPSSASSTSRAPSTAWSAARRRRS